MLSHQQSFFSHNMDFECCVRHFLKNAGHKFDYIRGYDHFIPTLRGTFRC